VTLQGVSTANKSVDELLGRQRLVIYVNQK